MDNRKDNKMEEKGIRFEYVLIMMVFCFIVGVLFANVLFDDEKQEEYVPSNTQADFEQIDYTPSETEEVETTTEQHEEKEDDSFMNEPVTGGFDVRELFYKVNGKNVKLSFKFEMIKPSYSSWNEKSHIRYYLYMNNELLNKADNEYMYNYEESLEEAKKSVDTFMKSLVVSPLTGEDGKTYLYVKINLPDYNVGYTDIYILSDSGLNLAYYIEGHQTTYHTITANDYIQLIPFPSNITDSEWEGEGVYHNVKDSKFYYLDVLEDAYNHEKGTCKAKLTQLLINNNKCSTKVIKEVEIGELEGAEGAGGGYIQFYTYPD